MKCHLEGSFQSLDPLHGGPEALLKLGQLTTEVSIITNKLLVDLEMETREFASTSRFGNNKELAM